VIVLGMIRLGMWLLPFQTLCRMVAKRQGPTGDLRKSDQDSIKRVARAVMIASRYVPSSTCLTQALAAMVLLGKIGQPASLRIGVSKGEEGNLRAHAWVESRGSIVIGDLKDLSRFDVLPPIEGKL
jgi:hypothetical protein